MTLPGLAHTIIEKEERKTVMRIDNALVEETFCLNENNGYLLVSHSLPDGSAQQLRLNINRNTMILGVFGQTMCLCSIRRGMRISALTSPQMTRSIPPQVNALFVAVQQNASCPPIPPMPELPRPPMPEPPPRPQPQPQAITTGRITKVDFGSRSLVTQELSDPDDQTQFHLTEDTSIVNRFGQDVPFERLEPGQVVRITHAQALTRSIPPETTAFHIVLL